MYKTSAQNKNKEDICKHLWIFHCVYFLLANTTNITTVRLLTELAVRASKIYFKSSTTCCELTLTLIIISYNQMKCKTNSL